MKPNDFLSEGFKEWLKAQPGEFAKKYFPSGPGVPWNQEKYRTDAEKQIEREKFAEFERAELEKKIMQVRKQFIDTFSATLKKAIDSDQLKIGVSEDILDFDSFNMIIEDEVAEKMAMKDWIQQFFVKQFAGNKIPLNTTAQGLITKTADEIEKKYASTKQIDPELVGSIWDLMYKIQHPVKNTGKPGEENTNDAPAKSDSTAPARSAAPVAAPVPAPTAGPQAGLAIEMPGTNIKYTYTPQWISADGKAAPAAVVKVLNQLASGVDKANLSTSDIVGARQSLGLTENKKKFKSQKK